MKVTLKWKQAKADRYLGQVEERDYAIDGPAIDGWVKAGWCDIVGDKPTKAPKKKAYKSPSRRVIEGADETR